MGLKQALLLNAALTATCAAICLAGAKMVISHTAIPQLWTIGLGLMLMSYVPMLLFAAFRPLAWLARTIILLDWGFVAIASLYSLANMTVIDALGWFLIGVPTGLVALFALLQQRGLAQRTVAS
ncbi:MAG: hypothetical protein WC068_10370 [Caulobacter sp.]